MRKIVTKSSKKTKELAAKLAAKFKGGEVLGLVGDLGAGKTRFVQGLAEYFGVREHASSPTFTLINEYKVVSRKSSVVNLVHIDCYRLESPQELLNIGFSDYLDSKSSVVVIEWAEKVKGILPKQTHWIYFEHGNKENERMIEVKS